MAPPKQPRILIAGGSVAGLTLANILQKIGIDFLVLEKYKNIAPDVGASIGILPSGFRILDQIGCHEALGALYGGVDAFQHSRLYAVDGSVVHDHTNISENGRNRLAYETIFIDRQQLIQVLYDNLRDQSKVLTKKGIVRVEQEPDKVSVTTDDGSVIEGNIVIGADGIHSVVRREMWRIADQEGSFPLKNREVPPTYYKCIFGISKPNSKFPQHNAQQNQGNNYSYLVITGPEHRIYWFLFEKLPQPVYGLHEKIPRYTDADKDALAAAHANDMINENLTFGELYETQRISTLQALPEVVFSRWHHGRIGTIGDAAHKYNPLTGHGGNSAIEDGAVLANLLHKALASKGSLNALTTADLNTIFEEHLALRQDRCKFLMKDSHDMQRVQAKETMFTRFIADHIVPRLSEDDVNERTASSVRGAARVDMLPMPRRRHVELYVDERPAKPWSSAVPRFIAYGVFVAVAVTALRTLEVPSEYVDMSSALGNATTSYPMGIKESYDLLQAIVLIFSEGVSWTDVGHTLQFLYLLLFITPILLVWYIEGSRHENRFSLLVSRPAIWGVVMNFVAVGVTAPLNFCLRIWTKGGSHATVGRYVPAAVARSIAPAVFVGYVLPTLLMFAPILPANVKQHLILLWQFAVVGVSVLVKTISQGGKGSVFDIYTLGDVPHLVAAYKTTFAFSLLYHAVFVAVVASGSDESGLSFVRLLEPTYNHMELDPTSRQAMMFTFLKWDFTFAALSCLLYGLYAVYELRFKGLVTTKLALTACIAFVSAQVVVGPGAAIVGLWWWREMRLVGETPVEQKGLGSDKKVLA
ncbi:hypothetical protein NX059_009787 [Plenodomus lindquistii]|nr:hypothetical protein NX059_009787 [Plenodomus lindquistii]